MDDLTICKKVAEIEGYTFCDGGKYFRCELTKHGKLVGYIDYNPLTDDALCFQLMVKYKVTFEACLFYNNMFTAFTYTEHEIKVLPKSHENSPNKAICLAIIEAHNGQVN